MDLKKMNRIISIDEQSLLLTAEAGINGFRLEQEVNRKGLTLAHYPASVYGATLGGYVAARGAGTLSAKYGKAEDLVVKLEAVLPTGEIISTLPVPKHACGPSLLQLLVGSEGTLGVITRSPCVSTRSRRRGMARLPVRRLAHGTGSRTNHDAPTYPNRDTAV
ncbi:MAG: FAD-binding oxidoreductase [Desulfobacterales bacterium]|nr:FAD-binding oxidoreductase [Desulfobacterales bacterium]